MSQVFFDQLGLAEPRYRLDLHSSDPEAMQPAIAERIASESPDLVLVYGDTSSTVAGARGAADASVPLAHVEAGLRSGDLEMPEERNRIETDRLAWLLFCPDDRSRTTLEGEGVLGRIYVVGDVMADANRIFAASARTSSPSHTTADLRRRDDPSRGQRVAAAARRDRRRASTSSTSSSSSPCILGHELANQGGRARRSEVTSG